MGALSSIGSLSGSLGSGGGAVRRGLGGMLPGGGTPPLGQPGQAGGFGEMAPGGGGGMPALGQTPGIVAGPGNGPGGMGGPGGPGGAPGGTGGPSGMGGLLGNLGDILKRFPGLTRRQPQNAQQSPQVLTAKSALGQQAGGPGIAQLLGQGQPGGPMAPGVAGGAARAGVGSQPSPWRTPPYAG